MHISIPNVSDIALLFELILFQGSFPIYAFGDCEPCFVHRLTLLISNVPEDYRRLGIVWAKLLIRASSSTIVMFLVSRTE